MFEGRKTMYSIKIYLSNGVIIDFTCEQYEVTKNRLTGEVSGYRFENASKCIAFLDMSQITAITAEKI